MKTKMIHDATRRADFGYLTRILDANPGLRLGDVKFTSFRRNPLHIAAMIGHVEFAKKILLSNPQLASEIDSQGFTPLHLASTRSNVGMVRVLLDANIDVDACTVQDKPRENRRYYTYVLSIINSRP